MRIRVVALAVSLLLFGLAQAQEKKPEKKPPESKPAKAPASPEGKPAKPSASPEAKPAKSSGPFTDERREIAQKEIPTANDLGDFRKLVYGQPQTTVRPATEHKALMEKVGRWLAYRLTWQEAQEGREGTMYQLLEGPPFSPHIDGAFKAIPPQPVNPPVDNAEKEKRDAQQKYREAFHAVMLPYLREVMKNRLIARVNAAMILHKWVMVGQEASFDELLAAVELPAESDAVRVWAFKAVHTQDATPVLALKDAGRIERAGLAICRWLEANISVPPANLSVMNDAEQDGIRYVRREAIRALGVIGRPAIVDKVEKGKSVKREGPAAELLLRIMSNEGVSPEASWGERAEAAAALGQLKHKQSPSYEPEFIVYHLGRFIAEMGAAAGDSREGTRWKYYASIVKNGSDDLAKDLAAHKEAGSFLQKMMVQANRVLIEVFEPGKGEPPASLNRWLNDTKPKATAAFRDG